MGTEGPNPKGIMQVGMGFMASKVLLSAVELELFTVLADEPMTGAQLGDRLALHPRAIADFLDTLLSLGLLAREGDGPDARYANTADTATFLDKRSPAYIGGILEMANGRLYRFWGDLTEALRTGQPQNELKHDARSPFEVIYADEARLEQFLRAMQGAQIGNFAALAEKVDFSKVGSLCDVGGANGSLCITLARAFPELACTSFDLPVVTPIARRHVEAMGLAERVKVVSGDFFADPLPSADVITMGNILHDWNEEKKQLLLRKAYQAVCPGGIFIAIENVIDDARRENTTGLLMSLNMLVELGDGFDYTGAQFDRWAREAGFTRTEILPLAGPASAAIAYR